MLTDPHKMTTDELYEELSEGYAREAGEKDGAAGIFDPSEVYGLDETLAYQEGYAATFRPAVDYKIDANGVIVSPGKFEGCHKDTPALWDLGMEGFADEDAGASLGFLLEDDPEFVAVILTENDNGFIYEEYFETLAEYHQAIEDIRETDEQTEDSEARN